jgi:hypothetical protein
MTENLQHQLMVWSGRKEHRPLVQLVSMELVLHQVASLPLARLERSHPPSMGLTGFKETQVLEALTFAPCHTHQTVFTHLLEQMAS